MWSEDRYPATAPSLTDYLNWMPSNDTQEDAENLQELLKPPPPPPPKGSQMPS
jgi:hypothetical protein